MKNHGNPDRCREIDGFVCDNVFVPVLRSRRGLYREIE